MEIKVNIPQNDYVEPKEVREEVVQKICSYLLPDSDNRGGTFYPFADGWYRSPNRYIAREISSRTGKETLTGLYNSTRATEYDKDRNPIRIHGEEMKVAFKVLREAGYHLFRVYDYGTWMGYKCSKKTFMEKGTEVFAFNDFID